MMKRLKSTITLLALGLCLSLSGFISQLSAAEINDNWRYVLKRPPKPWASVKFDDSKWREGTGGFGVPDTPGSRVSTNWRTNNIWLRKKFNLDKVPANPAILIHHDEEAQVFINGKLVLKFEGYITEYKVVEIPEEFKGQLKEGENLLAVHCHQTGGGQFIDVHVVDKDNVPELPPPVKNTKPFESKLITKWGEEVTPENAWTEYPRPLLTRSEWTNLNGNWDYAITPVEQKATPDSWGGKILVPYCLESKLGGVQRLLDSTEALWYHRSFEATPQENQRTLLNFEAVDYRCEVFVNGKSVGSHVGGNIPFQLDITEAVQDGKNELIVRVEDETEAWQLRGKQVINAHGIWYTQVSGIWQTVWLEQVSENHIDDLKISTSATEGTITINPQISGKGTLSIEVLSDGKQVASKNNVSGKTTIEVPHAQLWSPDSPHLYDLKVTLHGANGAVLDEVESYAGIRDVGKVQDENGHWRFTLNGKVIFHWGPLDQGWWPDGLLTPPSDEAMAFDIEWLKAAGFNMIRKHIKVEPRRYYAHCDRIGMLVWQDQVSGGRGPNWTRLAPNPEDATWPKEADDQFMVELEDMIDNLESYPSIVVWVPFNEAWGQHRTIEVGKWTVERDPSRLVNIASGGNFWPEGHIVDHHSYPHPSFPFDLGQGGRFDKFIKVVGEFGGHGYAVKEHLWDAERRNWGYGGLPQNQEEYLERYLTSLKIMDELQQQGIAGAVYTQTTDVEGEINGLMTYDRKVIKIPAEKLQEYHKVLFD